MIFTDLKSLTAFPQICVAHRCFRNKSKNRRRLNIVHLKFAELIVVRKTKVNRNEGQAPRK